jgi:hypothetical protein
MSTSDEKNGGAQPNDNVDQPIEFGMCKRDNTTEITLVDETSAMRSFGTSNRDFVHGLLHQIANAGARGERPDERGVRFMLAFIAGGKPTDEIETSILAQMAACHRAMMEAANRLAHAESLQEADSADRSLNRLARTFAALTEVRQRYRAAIEQHIITHNLPVRNAAQATIGNLAPLARDSVLNEPVTAPPLMADRRRLAIEASGKRRSAGAIARRRQKRYA